MGDTILYSKEDLQQVDNNISGVARLISFRMTNLKINVNDLVKGKHIDCKDIMETLAVEEQLKQARNGFKAMLETTAHFGGEELIEI